MFPAPSARQGYDAAFLSEVPADLTCVICTLVLRDPVQLDCGDRFCTPCFNNMVEYSERSGSEMLCPVDRQPIEKDKVFSDKGAARVIMNLKVKCKNHELGCDWTGCLGDLDPHEASCQYKTVSQIAQDTELKDLCKQLLERVQKCEERSEQKEKEIAHLKFAIKEMRENSSKNVELKELKEELIHLKLTVKDKKDDDSFKNEIKTLKDSICELENKVEILKKENNDILRKCTNELEQLRKKGSHLDNEFQNNKKKVSTANQSIGKCSSDIKNLNRQLENIRKDIRSNRSHLDKSLNEKMDEINVNTEEIEELLIHVMCLENVESLFNSVVDNEVQFRWVLEDFKECHSIGNFVYSPVFYPQLVGYCFQLMVGWSGEKKETMGVYLQLHRGRNGQEEKLQPFHYQYTLKVIGKDGNSEERRVPINSVECQKDDCFSIPDGLDVAKLGFGFPEMIKSPFDNYVINDTLSIMCTLHM